MKFYFRTSIIILLLLAGSVAATSFYGSYPNCLFPGTRPCPLAATIKSSDGGSGHTISVWVLDNSSIGCEEYHYQLVFPPKNYPGNATRIDFFDKTKKVCEKK